MGADFEMGRAGSRAESAVRCCLEQAALDSLAAPVVIHDQDQILYANKASSRIQPDLAPGAPLSAFVAPEAAVPAAERRQVMLGSGMALGDVTLKIARRGGGFHTIVTQGVPFAYEGGRKALVQLVRVVDGDVLSAFEPEAKPQYGSTCDRDAETCIHKAAFEALPVPATIIDRNTIRVANRAFREMLRWPSALRDRPVEMILHPDFARAGSERRHLVIDLGAPVVGASVKFKTYDGSDLYSMIDAVRVEYGDGAYMATIMRHSTRV